MRNRYSSLSRRAFLGGSSVAIGLPLLETFLPRKVSGQSAPVAPKRFLAYYVPCGMWMADWTPTTTGTDWTPTLLLDPLTAYKPYVTVLTGLQNTKQEAGPGDHAGGTGSFVVARTVPKEERVAAGPSIDQVIAAAIGQETKLPSLQIGGEEGNDAGTCDSGYPCSFTNQISFTQDGTPMPKQTNSLDIYNSLFAGTDPGASAQEAARRATLKTSALDIVIDEATALNPKLSPYDRQKLEQYLDSVREVERRTALVNNNPAQCSNTTPPADPADPGQYLETLSDLIALAFQCDATRVISLQWGNAGSNRDYGFYDPNAAGGHHTLSHHQGLQENIDKLKIIDHWEVEKLAYLLGKLSQLQDFDGQTLLDNSLIFYSSEISDGDRHNHDDMPVLLVGKAGGAINSGRHIVYDDSPWFANLFISIAGICGAPIDSFGENGNAPLDQLT